MILTCGAAEMVTQFAQNEQNMNAVERVLHYSDLPSEGATSTPDDPPPSWPEKGHVTFTNVEMAYREGLPLVLKNISFEVNAGEKVNPLLSLQCMSLIYRCRLELSAEREQVKTMLHFLNKSQLTTHPIRQEFVATGSLPVRRL